MGKLNQIQNAIRQLEGGKFQKLADQYVYLRFGYRNINPLGSVIGSNKTKTGTPDTFARLDNDKVVFTEYTTKKDGLAEKLHEDLDKCLDEKKSGVKPTEIEQIILFHTSVLKPEDENSLIKKAKDAGVKVTISGIGNISFDLCYHYPGLAQDELGVTADTGQVLSPNEFVEIYGRNQFTTPLNTGFYFREKEVEQIESALESERLVVVSGHAGVGKSRLALQSIENFQKQHSDYEIKCIIHRGVDVYDDLKAYFSKPGKFLIFVDDANRISNFDYVVDLLINKRDNQEIKVVATVRDYACNKVLSAARPAGEMFKIEILPLEDSQIKQLLEQEFGIKNHHFQDRIADIAQGNPRLAVMAANVALEHDTLGSISDVSSLYEKYFLSIKQDLDDKLFPNLLKVAGIVAFFRSVDMSNEKQMELIQSVFGISPDEFLTTAQKLHDFEVVDIYENEVVKPSDQVLATYLFYLCFFEEKRFSLKILLDAFFPSQAGLLREAIYPCLNAFNFKEIAKQLRPHVHDKWQELKAQGNTDSLYQFITVFWFLLQTEALIYIRDSIQGMEPEEVDMSKIDWAVHSSGSLSSLLNLIALFRQAGEVSTFKTALQLAYDYVARRPSEVPQTLYLLADRFGFDRYSSLEGYLLQSLVVETLWERTEKGKNELFSKIFIRVANKFLKTRVEGSETGSKHSIRIYHFELTATSKILKIRKSILEGLFQLYQNSSLEKEVLELIHEYSKEGYRVTTTEIITHDAELVIPFIKSYLRPDEFCHCLMVRDYLDLLEHHKIEFDNVLLKQFTTETYEIYKTLKFDYSDIRALKLDIKDYEKYRKEQISKKISGYDFDDYNRFLNQCLEIYSTLESDHLKYQFEMGIINALLMLADQNPGLYVEVILHYLDQDVSLRLNSCFLVDRLIKITGSSKVYKILSRSKHIDKTHWLFNYYQVLPVADIKPENPNQLYDLYKNAGHGELPSDFDFLLNYQAHDKLIVVHVAEIILDKARSDEHFAHSFTMLFNPYSEVNKQISSLFVNHVELLKEIYLVHSEGSDHADYDGHTLDQIVDSAPNFIAEMVEQHYKDKKLISRYDDSRDYTFIWKRRNHKTIMVRIVRTILKCEQQRGHIWGRYLEKFFISGRDGEPDTEIIARQDKLLKQVISYQAHNSDLMVLLFNTIEEFSDERQRELLSAFIRKNKNFEDFEKLPLLPAPLGWSGSAVPTLMKRIEYLESLLPLLDSAELLLHKQRVEQEIQHLIRWVESEKKSDFLDDR